MKKSWLLWGAVAVGAYLIYKKMSKGSTGSDKELAPPPIAPTTKPAPTSTTGATNDSQI